VNEAIAPIAHFGLTERRQCSLFALNQRRHESVDRCRRLNPLAEADLIVREIPDERLMPKRRWDGSDSRRNNGNRCWFISPRSLKYLAQFELKLSPELVAGIHKYDADVSVGNEVDQRVLDLGPAMHDFVGQGCGNSAPTKSSH
jgi:hypothetical protein